MNQTDSLAALQSIDFMHVIVTLCLFLVNVLLTYLISHDRLMVRLSHLGHEMVYMSAAIVVSHLFTTTAAERHVPVIAVFPYLVLWLLNLTLTRRVFELGQTRLHPITGVTLILGVLSVLSAMGGLVEALLRRFLPPAT